MKSKVTGILLAAGNSIRYGKGKNKNFEKIHGKYVLSYSFEIFLNSPVIDDIVLVIREEDQKFVHSFLKKYSLSKPVLVVFGGKSRMESVTHALEKSTSDVVVIHDGARPNITSSMIEKCVSFLSNYKGVIVGVKSKDTIKIVNELGEIISTTNRELTYLAQTPQCFERKLLLELHKKYIDSQDITDDAMILESEGYKVKMIEGDYKNIKLTTIDDYMLLCSTLK